MTKRSMTNTGKRCFAPLLALFNADVDRIAPLHPPTMPTQTRSVLAVHSLKVSIPYYRDVLGMGIDFETPGWCFLSRGNFAVMLGECPDAIAASDIGDHSYVAYVTVMDAGSLFHEFQSRAVEFIKPLTDEPWGMREFGVRTVDGHRIMFGQELPVNLGHRTALGGPTPAIVVLSALDAPQYKALMLHAYENSADAFTSTAEERAGEPDAWWVRRIADPQALTVAFGAIAGTELVGTVALEFSAKPKTRHKALVVGMYVMPAWRGKGLARGLLQAAIDHCIARGDIFGVQLGVTEGNEAAVKLYRELGFAQYGLEPMAIHTPSGYKSKHHMWLSIAGHPGSY